MRRPVLAAFVLAAVALGAAPARPPADPVDGALASLRRELSKAGCAEGAFTQTYVPAGFATGRAERGKLVLGGASRIRFDYDQPAGRLFAVDGERVTAVDPASKSVSRRTMTAGERARYPLFELAEGRRPEGFRLSFRRDSSGGWLEAVPVVADEELASGRILLGPQNRSVKRVEWTDGEGNRNRFDLEPLRARKDCGEAVFAPATPAGYRVSDGQ